MNAKRPALIVGMPYRRLLFRRPFTPMCLPLFPWFDLHQERFWVIPVMTVTETVINQIVRCVGVAPTGHGMMKRDLARLGYHTKDAHIKVSLDEEITFERRLERNRLLPAKGIVARHTSSGRADFTNGCRQWHGQSHQMLNKTRPVASIAINSVALNPVQTTIIARYYALRVALIAENDKQCPGQAGQRHQVLQRRETACLDTL